MEVRFLTSGDSPEIGSFAKDEIRDIPDALAKVFISRKQAEEVKKAKAQSKEA